MVPKTVVHRQILKVFQAYESKYRTLDQRQNAIGFGLRDIAKVAITNVAFSALIYRHRR
jgi:hypothetical protein